MRPVSWQERPPLSRNSAPLIHGPVLFNGWTFTLILVGTWGRSRGTCRRHHFNVARMVAGYEMYQISRFIDCSVLALVCAFGDTRIRR
ncbi:hypothetical protein EV363DRAFT_1200347 [Boletus edulis]|nr:hypothetical protein EV363DRAFT_1200347 [Boletus edulis]